MNPTSDDGKRVAVHAAKFILLALVIGMSCHKPSKTKDANGINPSGGPTNIVLKLPADKKQKKKKLYLTFDDGPNRGTRNVLHIVQDEQVPASFFIVGQHVAGSGYQQQLWDSLQAATAVDLCNHSYSHAGNQYAVYYQDPQRVVEDFKHTRDSLGLTNNIVRTPGRNIWRTDSASHTDLQKSAAAADSLQKAGFIVMGWDVEWKYDAKTMSLTTTADKLLAEIDSTFRHSKTVEPDNLVLLAHDQVYATSDDSMQLRHLLQKLKQRGEYEISLVTTYPGCSKLTTNTAKP